MSLGEQWITEQEILHQFSEVDSNPSLKMSDSEIKDFLIKNFSEFEVSFDNFSINSRKLKCKAVL